MDTITNETIETTDSLEEIMQKSLDEIKEKEDDFYSKKFYYSYSSLNKLLWNPQAFYQMYVLGLREERTEAHLVQGKLIHTLLLEPHKIDEEYVLSPAALPTGNMKTVVDQVFNKYMTNKEVYDNLGKSQLKDFSSEILEVMREIKYHQALKTDQQRFDKVVTPETESYWNFLINRGERTLIDQATLSFCQSAVEIVKQNKGVCNLLGLNATEFDNMVVESELAVQVDLKEKPFGIKGIIDNLIIKHDEKVIVINDIKTTSKDLKDFPETVEYYGYWLQAIMYCILISYRHSDLVAQGYMLRFNFVVIDRMFQTYAFPVTNEKMETWLTRFNENIAKAHWHFENKDYSLPYEFANGMVRL